MKTAVLVILDGFGFGNFKFTGFGIGFGNFQSFGFGIGFRLFEKKF